MQGLACFDVGAVQSATSQVVTMNGCAKLLFLPFVLCRKTGVDADQQGEGRSVTQPSSASFERIQQPAAPSSGAPPVAHLSTTLADLDDPLVSAILLHIALSDDGEGFAHLLRMKASPRIRTLHRSDLTDAWSA